MRALGTVAAGLGLAAALYAGARPVGPLPPLGAFLDPVRGVWAAARAEPVERSTVALPGLGRDVRVQYDRRGVPHVFASSEDDAVRALGYVVARDRLFQMELTWRAASGRLTELAGARALELDREARELGMPRAAERKLAALPAESRRYLDDYAAGVNAYIASLRDADVPVEYKLLHARPATWLPINSLHLFNRMGWLLAADAPERTRLRAASVVGTAAARDLFPDHTPIQEPIEPDEGQRAPRRDFHPLAPPGAPDTVADVLASLDDRLAPPGHDDATAAERSFASNNWAVMPRRTRDGHALLAGDPHLGLSLPSIWYEAHLHVTRGVDVYGVTIPGAPGIVIGFNRDVAWTVTNTGADVVDYYRETVDDTVAPTRYMLDGAWRPIERRVERYLAPDGRAIRTDTLRFTHRGAMTRTASGWLSMRWTVLEPSDETRAFRDAARATSAAELQEAFARSYFAPAQNVLAADRGGHVFLRSTGHYPIRPDTLGGAVIRDGSTSRSDWRGYWPVERYPQTADPAQGYAASANQDPQPPERAAAYFSNDHEFDPWRAMRINALLRADSAVTPDAMRRYQTDPGSARADWFVPYFLAAARTVAGRGGATPSLGAAAARLAEWDRRYTKDNQRAVLFEAAMTQLPARTWDELLRDGRRVATPSDAVLAELLADSTSAWWDDRRTAAVREDRDAVLAASLAAAYDSVVARYGEPERGGWRWDRIRFANVYHLLRLPGFSATNIPIQGGRSTLNPSSGDGNHGASWRMVVELGPTVWAWGTYPGGQSGNPGSGRYLDHIATWRDGQLEPLEFPSGPLDMRDSLPRLDLRGARR